jgi:pimeloyl-ACP methyl ester carboxylesterase
MSRCASGWPENGPLLCLLPGLRRPAEDLDPLAERLVEAGYSVAQPDPRGSGSTGPLNGLTLHDLARDIATMIEGLGAGDIVIIGHGFGNRIARTVAADHPALVRLVVLLGCSGKVQPSPEIAEAIRLAHAVDTPEDVRAKAVQAAWYGPGRDISVRMSGWSQPVMKAYLAAAAATDIADWWTAGSADVLIVQGLADVSAPPENGRSLKAEIGARAQLVEIENVSHAGRGQLGDASIASPCRSPSSRSSSNTAALSGMPLRRRLIKARCSRSPGR